MHGDGRGPFSTIRSHIAPAALHVYFLCIGCWGLESTRHEYDLLGATWPWWCKAGRLRLVPSVVAQVSEELFWPRLARGSVRRIGCESTRG